MSESNKDVEEGIEIGSHASVPLDTVEEELEKPMDKDDLQPMKVSAVGEPTKSGGQWDNWTDWMRGNGTAAELPGKYRLVTDEKARDYSLYSCRFLVLASAVSTKILTPNYVIMATPDAHDDSFPSTAPFDVNSATYFIPMCTLLGVAFASLIIGGLSDRVGRKRVLVVMGILGTIGTIVKYFARGNFWLYNVFSFIFGFFLGNLPVAMAYSGDVFSQKKDKEAEMGILVGCFVMGNSGGGMIAILMSSAGLFAPLWVGALLLAVGTVGVIMFLIEAGDSRMVEKHAEVDLEDEAEEMKRPETINQPVMWNVIGGALLDNIGSTGLFPLCLSPLALEQYYINPEPPIMTITGYQWLSVCVALMVIPSTLATPYIFAKIGIAATCVFGNVMTAVVTVLLLMIGNGPATEGYFYAFVVVMYAGFPFTVFSQLTTGPMLDVLAPEDKIGYVQGLNNMAMNFGMAFAPWLLGLLADATSTNTAIWTGIGISIGAALCNTPLTCRREMGKPIERPPVYKRILPGEDEDIVQKTLDGEFVSPDLLFELNRQRIHDKKTFLIPKVKPYEEDKDSLPELAQHAGETFRFRRDMRDRILQKMAEGKEDTEKVEEFCELINLAQGKLADTEGKKEAEQDMGQWIADYLSDNGYQPHTNPVLIKQMVLTAFPSITRERELTPDNIEEVLVKSGRVMQSYLTVSDRQKARYSLAGILKSQPAQNFYT